MDKMNKTKEVSRQRRHQVNVRLDDDLNDRLEELVIRTKKKKSELMRDAFAAELEKVVDKLDSEKGYDLEDLNVNLSNEEKQLLIKATSYIRSLLESLDKEVRVIGNNYNQIAKRMNQGQSLTANNGNTVKLLEHDYSDTLKKTREMVEVLWRIFI